MDVKRNMLEMVDKVNNHALIDSNSNIHAPLDEIHINPIAISTYDAIHNINNQIHNQNDMNSNNGIANNNSNEYDRQRKRDRIRSDNINNIVLNSVDNNSSNQQSNSVISSPQQQQQHQQFHQNEENEILLHQPMSDSETWTPLPSIQKAVVTMSFNVPDNLHNHCLKLSVGDIVEIGMKRENWLKGKIVGSNKWGIFPSKCISVQSGTRVLPLKQSISVDITDSNINTLSNVVVDDDDKAVQQQNVDENDKSKKNDVNGKKEMGVTSPTVYNTRLRPNIEVSVGEISTEPSISAILISDTHKSYTMQMESNYYVDGLLSPSSGAEVESPFSELLGSPRAQDQRMIASSETFSIFQPYGVPNSTEISRPFSSEEHLYSTGSTSIFKQITLQQHLVSDLSTGISYGLSKSTKEISREHTTKTVVKLASSVSDREVILNASKKSLLEEAELAKRRPVLSTLIERESSKDTNSPTLIKMHDSESSEKLKEKEEEEEEAEVGILDAEQSSNEKIEQNKETQKHSNDSAAIAVQDTNISIHPSLFPPSQSEIIEVISNEDTFELKKPQINFCDPLLSSTESPLLSSSQPSTMRSLSSSFNGNTSGLAKLQNPRGLIRYDSSPKVQRSTSSNSTRHQNISPEPLGQAMFTDSPIPSHRSSSINSHNAPALDIRTSSDSNSEFDELGFSKQDSRLESSPPRPTTILSSLASGSVKLDSTGLTSSPPMSQPDSSLSLSMSGTLSQIKRRFSRSSKKSMDNIDMSDKANRVSSPSPQQSSSFQLDSSAKSLQPISLSSSGNRNSFSFSSPNGLFGRRSSLSGAPGISNLASTSSSSSSLAATAAMSQGSEKVKKSKSELEREAQEKAWEQFMNQIGGKIENLNILELQRWRRYKDNGANNSVDGSLDSKSRCSSFASEEGIKISSPSSSFSLKNMFSFSGSSRSTSGEFERDLDSEVTSATAMVSTGGNDKPTHNRNSSLISISSPPPLPPNAEKLTHEQSLPSFSSSTSSTTKTGIFGSMKQGAIRRAQQAFGYDTKEKQPSSPSLQHQEQQITPTFTAKSPTLVPLPPPGINTARSKRLSNLRVIGTKLRPNSIYDQFTHLVRNFGVPPARRADVWFTCSGASIKMKEAGENYYRNLLEYIEVSPPLESASLIERDLRRTFPTNYHFAENEEGIGCLRRVLLAYSVRNQEVGYAQSMNFVTAMLLLHMGEEQAFWVLSAVVEDLLPGYFTKDMVGMLIDQRVFESLVERKIPSLYIHMKNLGLPLPPITCQWFLSIFVNSLPLASTLRVWDCFLHEGSKALFRVGLAILKILKNDLLAAHSFQDAYDILNELSNAKKSSKKVGPSRLLKCAYDPLWFGSFSRAVISDLRAFHKEECERYVHQQVHKISKASPKATAPIAIDQEIKSRSMVAEAALMRDKERSESQGAVKIFDTIQDHLNKTINESDLITENDNEEEVNEIGNDDDYDSVVEVPLPDGKTSGLYFESRFGGFSPFSLKFGFETEENKFVPSPSLSNKNSASSISNSMASPQLSSKGPNQQSRPYGRSKSLVFGNSSGNSNSNSNMKTDEDDYGYSSSSSRQRFSVLNETDGRRESSGTITSIASGQNIDESPFSMNRKTSGNSTTKRRLRTRSKSVESIFHEVNKDILSTNGESDDSSQRSKGDIKGNGNDQKNGLILDSSNDLVDLPYRKRLTSLAYVMRAKQIEEEEDDDFAETSPPYDGENEDETDVDEEETVTMFEIEPNQYRR